MKTEKIVRILSGMSMCFFLGSFCLANRIILLERFVNETDQEMIALVNMVTVAVIILITVMVLRNYIARKRRGLASYFRQSIVASFSIVVFFMELFFFCVYKIMIEGKPNGYAAFQSVVWEYDGGFFILLAIFLLFFLAFHGLTRQKLHDICMITEKIREIEENGFGNTIEVVGDDELARLCQSINHLSVELYEKEQREKDAERRKNELITNVSHDLRSPLTSIIGYIDLMKQDGITKEQYMQYVDVVERRLDGLNTMVNELFELAKLDSPELKLQYECTDMRMFLEHMANESAILFSQRGIHLQKELLDANCVVQVDAERFARAVQNLLDNAGKYTEDGIVSMSAAIKSTGQKPMLTICISNKIKDDVTIKLDSVFERFYKGDISRSDRNSSGLGLAITKRIIELHGGNISVDIKEHNIYFQVDMPVHSCPDGKI